MDLLRARTQKHQVHIQCVLQRVPPKPQYTHINFIKRQFPGDSIRRPLPTAADAHAYMLHLQLLCLAPHNAVRSDEGRYGISR